MEPDEPIVIPPPVIGTRIADLQTERWIRTVVLLVIGGPLLFTLTLGYAVKTTIDNNHRTQLLRDGVACLLADLDDHRHTNQFAHAELAHRHGIEINQPDVIPLSRAEAEALKKQCHHFVEGTVGIGGPSNIAEEGTP